MTLANTAPKEIKLGNDITTVFSFTFIVNQAPDILVTHTDSLGVETVVTEGSGTTQYAVTVGAYPGNGSITYPATLGTELATGDTLTISRSVELDQDTDLINLGAWKPEQVENTFDYSRMIDLQQQEQLDRSLRVPISDNSGANFELPAPVASSVIGIWDATALLIEIGPTVTEIANAETNAVAAAASAAAALVSENNSATSETNAGTSETNAAASAAAAAASAAAGLYATVIDVNFAASPYTIVEAEQGSLFQVDATGGVVVINLPDTTGLAVDFRCGIAKMDASANAITVNRSGTDTINGGTTESITEQYEIRNFTADISDGEWLMADFTPAVSATETVEGRVFLATAAEVNTGTDAVKVVTPDTLEQATTVLHPDISDSLTVGFVTTSFNVGATLNSATTLHISDGNIQHGTMTGAFTLTAPDDTDDGYLEFELTMDGTGGYALTLSGFNEISGVFDNTASVVNVLRVSKLNTNTYLEIVQAV